MKRLPGVVVLVVTLALAVAGLAAAQGSAFVPTLSLPTAPASDGPLAGIDPSGQTVIFWHQYSGEHLEVLDAMVDEFNSANPWGITVEASNQGGYGDLYQKMIAGLAGGELPTLVEAFQGQASTYQLEGALVDMDVFVDDPQWGFNAAEQADFYPGFFNHDISPQFGMRLGFPLRRSIEVLYVNEDALAELGYDELPTSWEALGELACAWAESGAGRVGLTLPGDVASFSEAVTFALGDDIFDYAANEYRYDNPATAYFVGYLQDMLDAGCFSRLAERGGDRVDFASGANLFYYGSSGALPFVRAALLDGDAGDFAWTVFAPPYADLGATDPTLKVNGASVSIPHTTPEAELAAWLFVRWFADPPQQARWAQVTNFFPVRASAAESMGDFLADDPQYAAAFALLAYDGRVVPTVAGYDVARQMMADALYAMLDGAPVDATLADLTTSANDVFLTQFQP
ncbi:MAG: extracellular solute-binding protein [Anaerolineae bacterium]|nr:extracellular solute-binding protein [Anaerolineae bacterium]